MIRCSIAVADECELVETFKSIESIPHRAIQIIHIQNNLTVSDLREVTFTVIYAYSIIAKIALTLSGGSYAPTN